MTNLIVLPGQLASAYGYRAYLRKVPRKYMLLLLPCAVGAAGGAFILRHTSAGSFAQLVPWLILFAVILFAFQPLLHFHLHEHMRRRTKNNTVLIFIALALLPLGVYGGYFGAGFGFVMLAFLGFTSLHDTHKMNAVKNLAASSMAIVSLACLYSTHLIQWEHGLSMAAGALVGGYAGARLAQRVSSHAIRVAVIAIGLTTATYLALRNY